MDEVAENAAQVLEHHCQLYPWSPSCGVLTAAKASASEFMNSAGMPQIDQASGCESVTLYSEDKLPVQYDTQHDLPAPVRRAVPIEFIPKKFL